MSRSVRNLSLTSDGTTVPGAGLAGGLLSAVLLALTVLSVFPARAATAPRPDDPEALDSGTGAGSGGSSSSSNASNFGGGTQLSINGRTGAVSIQADLVEIPGIVQPINLSISLTYRSEDALNNAESDTRYFGLPYGWWLNIPFIDNRSTYLNLHADGGQTYPIDANWRSAFAAAGSSQSLSIKTGLQQYNLADANFRDDLPSITVGGISSAYTFTNLGGMAKYFSANGLLIQETDRFGNSIRYFYDSDTNPRNARFQSIVDSWGNTTTFEYCDGGTCTEGEVIITLPDGRTVGWYAPDLNTLTYIIDAEGKRTHLSWEASSCEHGQAVLSGMTSPSGGMTSLTYNCLNVCTQPSATSCQADGNATTWPVVGLVYECPNNASGTKCPDGSPADYLTTRHSFESAGNPRNYTGFPLYSPYVPADPSDPEADSLMQSNDTAFTYTASSSKLSADGTEIHRGENDYNFLHLQREQRAYVRARQPNGSFGMSLSKETSYCYPTSSGSSDCQLTQSDYQNLPANYQSPTAVGTCAYNVGDAASGGARRSITTMAYDSFGKLVNQKTFFATSTQGIVGSCDRSTRLSTTGMRLVADEYMQHDTPTSPSSSGFLDLGESGGHFGLTTAQLIFLYLEEDESGVGAHEPLSSTSGPVLVKLSCNTLTTDSGEEKAGTMIKRKDMGLLPNDSEAPATPGLVEACDNPNWDLTVAPPKRTTYSYDAQGRSLGYETTWTPGFTPPAGISGTSGTVGYSLTGQNDDEEECGDGSSAGVLQIESTDATGSKTVNRICTLNGFHLANIDANGRRRLVEHSPTGLTTKKTSPNGTIRTTDYYYACPLAQDGRSRTCPTSTPTTCPFDDAAQKRTCIVDTVHAGTNPVTGAANSSFLDGTAVARIKDGLGRPAATRDNLGAGSSGYTDLQDVDATTYDSIGLVSSKQQSIGSSDPLVYRTTTTYGPKLRPSLVCGPRGDAHQFVHDDVAQSKLTTLNGVAREAYTLNDAHKLTSIANCEITSASTTSSSGGCPTVATELAATSCPTDAYYTYVLHDGIDQIHSVAARGEAATSSDSVSMVSGFTTYSADMLQYTYTYNGEAGSNTTTASSSWERDLMGQLLRREATVQANGVESVRATDTYDYNEIGQKVAEHNKLGGGLQESYEYSPIGALTKNSSYEGVDFHHYYDVLDRPIRYCFPSEDGGSEGESFLLDPVAGVPLTVRHFTNDASCSDCGAATCAGDKPGEAVHYSYTRFSELQSIVYENGSGAELQWAYDPYHRVTCFADAMATAKGYGCPESPTAVDFDPGPETLVAFYSYWPDDDPYRRGKRKSDCRGVLDASGSPAIRCVDTDYYTAVDAGGSCDPDLADVVGTYAGLPKRETYCAGGSCLDDEGTLLYETTYLYDEHWRPCSIETRNSIGRLIRGTTFTYDQFDQVLSETHSSTLDASSESNYRVENVYDGLLRLVAQTRTDADGDLIESLTYEYDAASNLIKKVRQAPKVTGPGPLDTPTRTPGPPDTPTLAPEPSSTPTLVPATATPPPTRNNFDADDGCQVQEARRPFWQLLLPILLFALVRRGNHPSRREVVDTMCKLLTIIVLLTTTAGQAVASTSVLTTTTTMYEYNDDGALTAITTQEDEQESTTTYLTWDNFLPDADDPTTGTVRSGNGRLLGDGPSPGTFVEEFQFDRRDRLIGYAGNGETVSYEFHPTQLMSSATQGESTPWRFYYESSADAQATNIYDEGDGLWSSRLGRVRYLSDGSEQSLLQPRKDVACLYDPQAEAVTPYRFDPFGAQQEDSVAGGYSDLRDNPFRYTREFRDPVWGGYYLRERWYDPRLPSFISRDPRSDHMSRFGYSAGNPEMNVDPSGMGHKSFGRMLNSLNKGLGGHFARVLLSPFLGVGELAAHPKAFWHQIATDQDATIAFLILGAVGAVAVPGVQYFDPLFTTSISLGWRFTGTITFDAMLGLGQSAAAAAGSEHFNWETFGQGAEYTIGGIAWTHGLAGYGYRPFNLKREGVAEFYADLVAKKGFPEGAGQYVDIFRERTGGRFGDFTRWTSPAQEHFNLGGYHERLIAITAKGDVYINEFEDGFVEGRVSDFGRLEYGRSGSFKPGSFYNEAGEDSSRFSYLGRKKIAPGQFLTFNPGNFKTATEAELDKVFKERNTPGRFKNNSQYHAKLIRQRLGF